MKQTGRACPPSLGYKVYAFQYTDRRLCAMPVSVAGAKEIHCFIDARLLNQSVAALWQDG